MRHPFLPGHHRQTWPWPAGRPYPAHQPASLVALHGLKYSSHNLKQLTSHPEFKEEAVKAMIETSRPIVQVAKELGFYEGTLGNWVNTYMQVTSRH
ncbi:MAG: transposase [Actinoallomurus sp.]